MSPKNQFPISTLAVVFLAIAVPVVTVAQYYNNNFGNPAATGNYAEPIPGYPVSSTTPGSPQNYSPGYPPDPTFVMPNPVIDQSAVPASNSYGGMPTTPQYPVTQYPVTTPTVQPYYNLPPQENMVATGAMPPAAPNYSETPYPEPSFPAPAFAAPSYPPTQYELPQFMPPPPPPPFPPSDGVNPELVALGGVGNAYNGTGQSGGAMHAYQQPGTRESLANQGLVTREREQLTDRRQADQKYISAYEEIINKKNPDAWRTPMPPYAGPLANRGIGKEEDSLFSQASYFSQTIKQDDYEYDWEAESEHYFNFSMLDPTRMGERMKAWVGLGPDEDKARKHFDNGAELMRRKEYSKAANEFRWAAYFARASALEEDALYHAAECYYLDKRYAYALDQYMKLLTDFQSSPYKAEVVANTYGVARTWIKQVTEDNVAYLNLRDRSRPTFDTFGYAERGLKAIYINCPSDPMAAESIFLLANGYMRLGRVQGDAHFEHAVEYFKQLRDSYPNSEHIVAAMRLEIICREKAGLGPDYDARHIEEAQKIAKQMKQFPLKANEKDELLQMQNQLNEQMAQKVWVTGKFYDDRYDYGAARLQYLKIITDYPATQYADMARTRYEQIRDFPDELPSDWERMKSALRLKWR